jgi:CBS domain containing-hemolysin-like protein
VDSLFLIIIFILIGLLFSSFFSASEMAYTAVNRHRLETLANQGNTLARRAWRIANQYDQYSAALLLGNALVNIFISSVTALISLRYLSGIFPSQAFATTLSATVIFFIIVIVGELIPKMIGKVHALTFSLWFVWPVTIFRIIFTPAVLLMSVIVLPVKRLFVQKRRENRQRYSDDELETMVDTIEEKGMIDEKKGDLIRSTISFSDKKAYEVMTPRVDIFAFDIEEDSKHLVLHPDIFSYSRIPIFDQTLDKIIGILPTKRVYKRFLQKITIDLPALLLPPLFVPRNLSLTKVIGLLKEHKQQMAIVIDEHGGTEGLITLEDIMEEIVGEIWDETDDVLPAIIKQNDEEFLVEGNLHIDSLFKELNLDIEESPDYATVNGWVTNQLGKFAKVGDQFTFRHLKILVLEVEKFTVEKIKVTILQPEVEENPTEND